MLTNKMNIATKVANLINRPPQISKEEAAKLLRPGFFVGREPTAVEFTGRQTAEAPQVDWYSSASEKTMWEGHDEVRHMRSLMKAAKFDDQTINDLNRAPGEFESSSVRIMEENASAPAVQVRESATFSSESESLEFSESRGSFVSEGYYRKQNGFEILGSRGDGRPMEVVVSPNGAMTIFQ